MARKPKPEHVDLLDYRPGIEVPPVKAREGCWNEDDIRPPGVYKAPTLKMRKFVNFYLGEADGNARRAAAMVGYAQPDKAAERLMTRPWVRAQINHLITQAMPPGEILVRLSRQASNDITDFADCFIEREDVIGVSKGGQPITQKRTVLDMAKVKRKKLGYLIKKITPGKYGDTVELYDAQAALTLMAKHHKLLVDRVETNSNVDLDAMSDEELEKLSKRLK